MRGLGQNARIQNNFTRLINLQQMTEYLRIKPLIIKIKYKVGK